MRQIHHRAGDSQNQVSKSCGAAAADDQCRTVGERDAIATAVRGLNLDNPIEPDDRRTMYPQELCGIESGLELSQRSMDKIAAAFGVDARVIALGSDPGNIRHRQRHHPLALWHQQPVRARTKIAEQGRDTVGGRSCSAPILQPIHRGSEPCLGERLQQVIDRVHFERAQRIAIVRRAGLSSSATSR